MGKYRVLQIIRKDIVRPFMCMCLIYRFAAVVFSKNIILSYKFTVNWQRLF